jgi:hypothetical protein
MIFAFLCGLVAYIGLIRFQIRLYRRGELTEARFVLFQVAIVGFIILLGSLAFLPTIEEQQIGIGMSFLFYLAGIPTARWFYRKVITHKT